MEHTLRYELEAKRQMSFCAWMALGLLNMALAYWAGYRQGRRREYRRVMKALERSLPPGGDV